MLTITRRERQRLANREGILDAALAIAERESWSAVTIRKIADEIDYTSPIIYQHFSNKEAALQALIERGFTDLEASMRRALTGDDPEMRLLALGRAYVHFARDHRRLYELMHGLGGVALEPSERTAAAGGVIALSIEAIQAWAQERGATLDDFYAASETSWGVLHGMTTLGMLPDIGFERAEQLAVEALRALLQYWENLMT